MKRLLVLTVVAIAIAGATLPLWAPCNVQSDVCSRWCGLRHYDSGIQAAACRADCVGKRLSCLAERKGITRKR